MNTLKIELLKSKRVGTYVLLAIALVFMVLFALLEIYAFKSSLGLANIKQVMVGQQKLLNLLMAIFLCINIGREYSDNTLRRSIIEGYKRHRFFNGKLIILFISVLFNLVLFWLTLAFASVASGHWEVAKGLFTVSTAINTLVDFISTGIFAFFLVFVTRSLAFGIVLYFVWPIAEGLTKAVEMILVQTKNQEVHVYRYLPLGSMDTVLQSHDALGVPQVLLAVFYLLLMLLIPYLLFLKRDIK